MYSREFYQSIIWKRHYLEKSMKKLLGGALKAGVLIGDCRMYAACTQFVNSLYTVCTYFVHFPILKKPYFEKSRFLKKKTPIFN
jgi:hypothetical protein